MFNAPFNALLIAGLALGLNACGGDGDKGASSSAAQPAADSRLMAITVPHWTTFPIDISKNPDGTERLNIPDPTLGMQRVEIRSRDAQGNITALNNEGPFSSVISFLNNRIGMICGSDVHFKKALPGWEANSGHYVYLSTEFAEVDYRELFGKKFRYYDDCKNDRGFSIDASGNTLELDDPTDTPAQNISRIFAPEGHKLGTDISAVISRAKAYRYIADGKTIYAIVEIIAVDPDIPEAKAREQKVFFAVSE